MLPSASLFVLFLLSSVSKPGPFKYYVGRNVVEGGRVSHFSRKKTLRSVQFNVISITSGVDGCHIFRKKRYITLEWPLIY